MVKRSRTVTSATGDVDNYRCLPTATDGCQQNHRQVSDRSPMEHRQTIDSYQRVVQHSKHCIGQSLQRLMVWKRFRYRIRNCSCLGMIGQLPFLASWWKAEAFQRFSPQIQNLFIPIALFLCCALSAPSLLLFAPSSFLPSLTDFTEWRKPLFSLCPLLIPLSLSSWAFWFLKAFHC